MCACSPTLDWREVRPEGSGVVALFPCKPSTDVRMVTLAETRVRMVLSACRAGDTTWALAFFDITDPTRIAPAMAALREAAVVNLTGTAQRVGPLRISGMTPHPQAERVRIVGKLPGDEPVTLEAGFFTKGTWVFQATVMGAASGKVAVDTFFEGLKLPS